MFDVDVTDFDPPVAVEVVCAVEGAVLVDPPDMPVMNSCACCAVGNFLYLAPGKDLICASHSSLEYLSSMLDRAGSRNVPGGVYARTTSNSYGVECCTFGH